MRSAKEKVNEPPTHHSVGSFESRIRSTRKLVAKDAPGRSARTHSDTTGRASGISQCGDEDGRRADRPPSASSREWSPHHASVPGGAIPQPERLEALGL